MINSTQFVDQDAQMSFDWEFLPVVEQEANELENAICRWEDDGGPVGRENADAE